jgi:hypothetical protein
MKNNLYALGHLIELKDTLGEDEDDEVSQRWNLDLVLEEEHLVQAAGWLGEEE